MGFFLKIGNTFSSMLSSGMSFVVKDDFHQLRVAYRVEQSGISVNFPLDKRVMPEVTPQLISLVSLHFERMNNFIQTEKSLTLNDSFEFEISAFFTGFKLLASIK